MVKNELPQVKQKLQRLVAPLPFQQALKTLLTAIDRSKKLSTEEKDKLYERIYQQIQSVTEAVLVLHMPQKSLEDLVAHPDALTLSSYADLIVETVRDPKTAEELTSALADLVHDVSQAILEKL